MIDSSFSSVDVYDVAAGVLLFASGIRCLVLARRRPYWVLVCIVSWLTWFFCRFYNDPSTALSTLRTRVSEAFDATHVVAESVARMMYSWSMLVAPFFMDSLMLFASVWDMMSANQRFGTMLVAMFAAAGWKTFTTVRNNAKNIKRVLFHLSFVVLGPILWVFLHNGIVEEWLTFATDCVLTWIPFALSLSAFRSAAVRRQIDAKSSSTTKNTKKSWMDWWRTQNHHSIRNSSSSLGRAVQRCGVWLSWWSCWPLFVLFADVLENFQDNRESEFEASLSTDANYSKAIRCALIVLAIYCQFWNGSRFFIGAVAPVFSLVLTWSAAILPNLTRSVLGIDHLSIFGFVMRVVNYLRAHKILSLCSLAIVSIAVARFLYFAIRAVGAFLKALVIWGAAADAWRTVDQEIFQAYEQKLAFWVASQVLVAATSLPFIGLLISIWEPLLLSASLLFGDSFLRVVVVSFIEPIRKVIETRTPRLSRRVRRRIAESTSTPSSESHKKK